MYQGIATKVLTGEVRLSYAHLSEPYANPNQQNATEKYSVTLLIPKSDVTTKADIDSAIAAAYEEAVKTHWQGARPQLRSPLIYDGDGMRNDGTPFGSECANHWVITANSIYKPEVVDISNIKVPLDPRDIYSGMYARVTLNFFDFNSNGNKGIGCGLGNVMKTRDGERLAGGASAASDFEGLESPQPQQGFYPQQGYVPQQQPTYNQPQQGYVPQQPTYSQPQQGYVPQQPTYGQPQQGYAPQQPTYNPNQQAFDPNAYLNGGYPPV